MTNTTFQPKRWLTICLGFLLQPFVFLYLNRGIIFCLYIPAIIAVGLIDLSTGSFYSLTFSLICPLHGYYLAQRPQNKKRSWYSYWQGVIGCYLGMWLVIFLGRSFLYEPFYIPGLSMSPTLEPGHYVLIKKWGFNTYGTYGISLWNRNISDASLMQGGNIYAFKPPHTQAIFIKRLIAKPGDTLEISQREIRLNGKLLTTTFLYKEGHRSFYHESLDKQRYTIMYQNYRPLKKAISLTIPEGQYFFMGDNRDNSADSRIWGLVDGEHIIGEVSYIVKP